MRKSTNRITLDLQAAQMPIALYMKTSDTARLLEISITDGGFPFRMDENCKAQIIAHKPDGTPVTKACAIHGGAIRYEVSADIINIPGQITCEIRVEDGSDSVTTASFLVFSERSLYDSSGVG